MNKREEVKKMTDFLILYLTEYKWNQEDKSLSIMRGTLREKQQVTNKCISRKLPLFLL